MDSRFHKQQDDIKRLQEENKEAIAKQQELREALQEKEDVIDSNEVEIEELKRQKSTSLPLLSSNIKNKGTQISLREFNQDFGCQVSMRVVDRNPQGAGLQIQYVP